MYSLLDNLTKAGVPPLPINFPDGTRLLVLPFGGRLLGLFPPEKGENFLWTNPALASPESTSAWLKRDGWLNFGGDRTWLAPEMVLLTTPKDIKDRKGVYRYETCYIQP